MFERNVYDNIAFVPYIKGMRTPTAFVNTFRRKTSKHQDKQINISEKMRNRASIDLRAWSVLTFVVNMIKRQIARTVTPQKISSPFFIVIRLKVSNVGIRCLGRFFHV